MIEVLKNECKLSGNKRRVRITNVQVMPLSKVGMEERAHISQGNEQITGIKSTNCPGRERRQGQGTHPKGTFVLANLSALHPEGFSFKRLFKGVKQGRDMIISEL